MAYNKTLEFTSVVRGYQYYRTFWKPEPNEILNCYHENDNAFDRFAIKVCEFGKEIPVGHLPNQISRVKNLLLYKEGSKFLVKLVLTCQELSAIFQCWKIIGI